MPEETEVKSGAAIEIPIAEPPAFPNDPPMADPGVTLELMTPEQQRLFQLKERARILIANGQMTVDEAFERNLIGQADGAAWKLGKPIKDPEPVIQAPDNPAGGAPPDKRCC